MLLIEESEAEAALMAAALARPGLSVTGAPDETVVLALAGAAALTAPPAALLQRLQAQGIPVVGIAAGLSEVQKRHALEAGVREVHDRPQQWQPYAALIESLVGRFIRKG